MNALQDRVAVHECAAGGGEGRARLHVAAVGSYNSLVPLADEGVGEVEVAVRMLDAIVPKGRPACVVKVDAEGMELEVLRGAGRVLAESPRAGVIAEFGPSHLARVGISVADWLSACSRRMASCRGRSRMRRAGSARCGRGAGDGVLTQPALAARAAGELSGAAARMSRPRVSTILVIGAGGHAKVVIEALRAAGFDPVGLVDPRPDALALLGVPVLGGDDVLPRLRAEGIETAIVALGANRARERAGEGLRALGFRLPAVVHPTAFISPSARIEEGVVVMARAVVGTLAEIGALAILNTGCIVEHDNRIGPLRPHRTRSRARRHRAGRRTRPRRRGRGGTAGGLHRRGRGGGRRVRGCRRRAGRCGRGRRSGAAAARAPAVRVGIVSASVPLREDAEAVMGEGLEAALRAAGHEAELILLPFAEAPEAQLVQRAAYRTMEFAPHYDLVVTLRTPAEVVRHPRKMAWLARVPRPPEDGATLVGPSTRGCVRAFVAHGSARGAASAGGERGRGRASPRGRSGREGRGTG